MTATAAQITWLNRHRELMRMTHGELIATNKALLARKNRERQRVFESSSKYALAATICALEGLSYEYEPEPGTLEADGEEA